VGVVAGADHRDQSPDDPAVGERPIDGIVEPVGKLGVARPGSGRRQG
jgi:hypothetical protein